MADARAMPYPKVSANRRDAFEEDRGHTSVVAGSDPVCGTGPWPRWDPGSHEPPSPS